MNRAFASHDKKGTAGRISRLTAQDNTANFTTFAFT
jgi:hypothetical protein